MNFRAQLVKVRFSFRTKHENFNRNYCLVFVRFEKLWGNERFLALYKCAWERFVLPKDIPY